MLWRSRCRFLALRCRRHYSTPTDPYSNFQKLRAFPFAFDEHKAKSYLGLVGSAMCNKDHISSAVARFFPNIGLQSFQPTRIVPLYFPAWIFDAELRGNVRYQDVEREAVVQLQDGYLPGSDFNVISSVPIFSAEVTTAEDQPWSTDLMNQFGQEISCLPFTVHPLSGLKALEPWKPDFFSGLHVYTNTMKANLAVFRPILIPMYLAQYEAETQIPGENRQVTLFIQAASNDTPVFGYRSPTSYTDEYDRGFDELSKTLKFVPSPNSEVYTFGPKNKFVNVSTFSLSPPRDISKALSRWIEWKMHDPETIQEIAQSSDLSSPLVDNDPRIRDYDPDERSQVEDWMEVGSEMMMVHRILERINEQMESIGDDAPNHMRAPIESLEANEKELSQKRKEALPEWWREYEQTQEQEDNDDQDVSNSHS